MKRSAFTMVELLVVIALATTVVTVALRFMTRGASNVARGSFNALASNQAALICYNIRTDILRSRADLIMLPNNGENWEGNGEWIIPYIDGFHVAKYTIKTENNDSYLIREYPSPESGSMKKKNLGEDYISSFKVSKVPNHGYKINITILENESSKIPVEWSTVIYPPLISSGYLDDYWVPITSLDSED